MSNRKMVHMAAQPRRLFIVEDRRSQYSQRRELDAETYVLYEVDELLDEAIEAIEALEIKKCSDLPTKSHVEIAEKFRKRLVKRLTQARYP